MAGDSPLKFIEGRPMEVGHITCCASSCSYPRGIIFGSNRGLFHIADIDAKPRRVRRWPVGYVLSGVGGAVCYEEASGTGRLAILDSKLEEIKTDSSLARRINPKAYLEGELIIFHQGDFVMLDLDSGRRRVLSRFVPTRTISPFVPVDEGFDFIAIKRGTDWSTNLHRLTVSEDRASADVINLAQAEDPIFARHMLRLSCDEYLVAPQSQSMLEIYRIFDGQIPGLRMWTLVQAPGDVHPVGMVQVDKNIYLVGTEGVLIFELTTAPGQS